MKESVALAWNLNDEALGHLMPNDQSPHHRKGGGSSSFLRDRHDWSSVPHANERGNRTKFSGFLSGQPVISKHVRCSR